MTREDDSTTTGQTKMYKTHYFECRDINKVFLN